MEIKIDTNGSDVELVTFLHSLTINRSQKEQSAVKTANTKKKGRPRKRTRNRLRRMTSWMIRKWPISERTFSGMVIRMLTQQRKEKERALIAGDASAEAVAALIFMALHDEFQFGKVRVEQSFRLWNDLPYSASYESQVSRNGYNRGRMDRNFVKKVMIVIGADKIDNKRLRNTLYQVLTDTVINMLYVLCNKYGFKAAEVHRLEKRLYDYAEIMLDPKTYGVTIWQFMASIRYELNVRCDMLKEHEKKYGRVDLGPKWGLNQITGKPRKKNEAI